jgi:hypothetical protein
MKLSKNFHLSEFTTSQTAARRRIDNTPPPAVIKALTDLCTHVLEPVRAHFGPVRVSSGYRSPALNRAVGGSKTSQHVLGQAADIECPGVSNAELARWIARNTDFDQLILEFYTPGQPNSGWVHVSWRPTDRRRQSLTAARIKTLGVLRTKYLPGIAT